MKSQLWRKKFTGYSTHEILDSPLLAMYEPAIDAKCFIYSKIFVHTPIASGV